jgi:hypothetical protein
MKTIPDEPGYSRAVLTSVLGDDAFYLGLSGTGVSVFICGFINHWLSPSVLNTAEARD